MNNISLSTENIMFFNFVMFNDHSLNEIDSTENVIKYIKDNLNDVLLKFKEKEFEDSFVNIFMFICNFKRTEYIKCFEILKPSLFIIIKNKKNIGKHIKPTKDFNIWEYFLNNYEFLNCEIWQLRTYFKNQWEKVIKTNNVDLEFFNTSIDYVFKSILMYSDKRYYYYEVIKALKARNFYNSNELKSKFESFGKENNLFI